MLDGLRGVAALIVVVYHAVGPGFHVTLFSRGYLAVDFFFMLSGFVLSHAYDHRFDAGLGWVSFIILRFRRLWPAMATGVMLGVAAAWGGNMHPGLLAIRTVAALLFVPLPLVAASLFLLNGVQWSLMFELFANALHAGPFKRATPAMLGRWLGLSIPLLFGVAYMHGDLAVGPISADWFGGFARVMVAYLLGMLLYRLWLRIGVDAAKRDPFWPLAAMLAAMLVPASFPAGWWWVDPMIVLGVFPAVLWLGATAAGGARWHGAASMGGAISYPLYAFHLPLLAVSERLGDQIGGAVDGLLKLAAVMVATGLAWLWSRARYDLPRITFATVPQPSSASA